MNIVLGLTAAAAIAVLLLEYGFRKDQQPIPSFYLHVADGVIVGTTLKKDSTTTNPTTTDPPTNSTTTDPPTATDPPAGPATRAPSAASAPAARPYTTVATRVTPD